MMMLGVGLLTVVCPRVYFTGLLKRKERRYVYSSILELPTVNALVLHTHAHAHTRTRTYTVVERTQKRHKDTLRHHSRIHTTITVGSRHYCTTVDTV